jgi:magnesium transporter
MNVNVPHNDLDTGPFNAFGIVIALAVTVLSAYLYVVRYWWKTAKRKRVPIL